MEEKKTVYKYRDRRVTYNKHRVKILAHNREYLRQLRLLVLQHYSSIIPFCACCGEKEIKFLSIDHINGGGSKHRKGICNGKGGNMSAWLRKNNFPDGFQVLCHNCNMAKGFYGQCPHREIINNVV